MGPVIVVHRPSRGGGRRVTVGPATLGLARTDADLIEFLRRAGLENAEDIVLSDSPHIVWRGGRAHEYDAG
ncbi:hypothetical protein [Streptomyces sp. VRA16 Mangrove soil]|uniref:hypothetical protein n=1 Tax=Streptomyces sp. VRA16 Mangrove soil TaxID=2817434 RepID=UPI001A9DE55E|nr:hypothetical protein [Streptomyces sp. VRA16 Mangrove soil]MBO1332749.1 hypothetical protein [Streptomyces sp. VRA16 Mangrove soil]